jgi:pyruvate/2-oxoglutarate dehydrogenase complex dihydrolipoamide acyltransferase (E2) component
MKMRLEMPLVDASFRGGKVVTWHVSEGDQIDLGAELCTVALDEFAVLRRTSRATLLARGRRRRLRGGMEVRTGKVVAEAMIRASDRAVVRAITKAPGDPVATGDLLAIVSTSGDEDAGSNGWDSARPMRVVATLVGMEED